ncbi:MAG: 1-deoxy-D-xylulose-5-phosphate synthase [Elusimicrobia bacterium]|nr:1-deoxy-D-xylulose-5-phosphate synthase [Elusimicrobiota bacterium]
MILDTINDPKDLRVINRKHLSTLASEVRNKIVEVTSEKGGHLAPSLGVVELTIALHYCLDTPKDKIIWDVGHQAYAHKILTGRRDEFDNLRSLGGISGFPNINESEYDSFGVGHASTSISAALGMVCARDIKKENYKVAAVIGDGSLTGGLAYEGLNNAGHLKKDMLVILNDNEMFISKKVGAMGEYLTRILTFAPLQKIEERIKNILGRHPNWGQELIQLARRSKVMLTPGMLFEEMGFEYFGPVDGHDIELLINTINKIKDLDGPKLLHIITKKGKGYAPAEDNPEKFHGTGSFDLVTGEAKKEGSYKLNYQDVFGDTIVELARKNSKIIAITAAMESGTGLKKFRENFPERFFDVGIAEQHAVTFAAGLACCGLKPVCAIYSTFLQRSYDQIIHDVALQELPVIFAIDRAGLVGEDGPTHHGIFDLSYLCSVPNMIVTAPSDEGEMRNMLFSSFEWGKPAAIRYPRGEVAGVEVEEKFSFIEIGKSRILREGEDITIIALGTLAAAAAAAAELLHKDGISAEVIDLRFAKPIDTETIIGSAVKTGRVITLEENVLTGGVGERITRILPGNLKPLNIAIPDSFVTFGKIRELKARLGLDSAAVYRKAKELVAGLKST